MKKWDPMFELRWPRRKIGMRFWLDMSFSYYDKNYQGITDQVIAMHEGLTDCEIGKFAFKYKPVSAREFLKKLFKESPTRPAGGKESE